MAPVGTDLDTMITGYLLSAARAIDVYLDVRYGFFEDGVTVPYALEFEGNENLNYINLPAFVSGSISEVKDSSGAVLPTSEYKIIGNKLYPINYIYTPSTIYTVNALWGFSQVPYEIEEACLEIAALWYRAKDSGFRGTVEDLQTGTRVYETDFPKPAKTILDSWKRKLERNGFVLSSIF